MRVVALSMLALAILNVAALACPFSGAAEAQPPIRAVAPPPQPSSPGLTPAEYRIRVEAASKAVARRRPEDARAVAAGLREIRSVVMPDGTEVHPDLSLAVAALEEQPPDFSDADANLRTLLDGLSGSPNVTGASDGRARLQGILLRPEFTAKPQQNSIQERLGRLWISLIERLLDILGPARAILPAWDLSALWVVLALLTLGGVGLVALLIAGGLRRSMGPEVDAVMLDGRSRMLDAEGMRATARGLAQKGDYRGAVRELYLAVLLKWDEQGRLRFDRALTNREVLARVRSSENGPQLVDRMAPLVEQFDRFWYGAVPCSVEDFAAFSGLAEAAWEAP